MSLDFAEFFEQMHGHPPFPWQSRLAAHVVAEGSWPSLLDLPTGVGKTSAIDVALFALAVDPARAPRRVFLVVDRRLIVDQAAEHARAIQDAMRAGRGARIAARLRALFDGGPDDDPFEVAVLRGGMPRESEWATRPDRPVVGLSTVDQVGSRLLFRGYGVSPRMASVHAGLLGHDALYLLDEVHLSSPFASTLRQIRTGWRRARDFPERADRFGVVEMSATPGAAAEDGFGLSDDDRAHPIVKTRLGASKRAICEVVAVKGKDEAMKRRSLAQAAAARARSMVEAGARSVAVVVNRVDTARLAWQALDAIAELDAHLLTGRMRGIDRDQQYREHVKARAEAGRDRSIDGRPLVVVATQTIEAGADLDFDGLVTECASLDALKQRFGRVDRRGEVGETQSTILVRSDQKDDSTSDPVYGSALALTWAFLEGLGEDLDFGIDALPRPEDPASLTAPSDRAPVILPSYLDAWSSTSPRPEPDPDIALWLHGIEPRSAEVQIVWRTEVDEDDLSADIDNDISNITAALAACPPTPAEALALPIAAARAWLRGDDETEVADTGAARAEEPRRRDKTKTGFIVRWRGDETDRVDVGDILPGDTLVVPVSRGGLTAFNWDPTNRTTPVSDLGDEAQAAYGRVATWRVGRRALEQIPEHERPRIPVIPPDEGIKPKEVIAEWLGALEEQRETADSAPAWAARLESVGLRPRWIHLPNGDFVLKRREGVAHPATRRITTVMNPAPATESDDGSLLGVPITLARHSDDVRRWSRRFTRALDLPEQLAEDVVLAGWFHDLGKADPRFQMWLCGGSEVQFAAQDEPLAKSGMPAGDLQTILQARERSGYPKGERHELLSVQLLEASPGALDKAHDPDLVLHLVGSHHGWCRPFAPAIDPPEDVPVTMELEGQAFAASSRHRMARLDSGVADRFWRLTERYGWWGLAWLEALVRLADHRASQEVSQ